MKKSIKLLFAFIAVLALNACTQNDDVEFIAQPDVEGINFTNTFNDNYVLTPATSGNIAERFVWNTVDFGVATNITYELQGSTDANFSNFDVIGNTTDNNLAVKVSQLMTLATDAGLDADATTDAPNTGQIFFRVRAYAGTDGGNGMDVTSDIKPLTVTLPEASVEEGAPSFRQFYMVGDATAAGWSNNNNNTPLFRDPNNENIYYFTGRFAGGADVEGFKLLETLGAWQPQWGTNDGTTLAVNTGDGSDPSAFPVASDAYYSFMVNLDDNTYTFDTYDASSATTYDAVGIIGTATTGDDNGWNDDIDLTQSDFNPHIWYIQNLELFDGEAKFRANNAWDVSWGADTALSGQGANNNDPNIPVTAGTYNVWFNDISQRYIFIPVE
ncbi:MAG: SusE domain-containing protein [Gillisia sp.]